ncbi:hypothetical protein ACH5RR_030894 [Cinchona calisaya]|uniref:TF-B3 domain-containing protein n=1 Tax=Cinchona calisaya TaxID=153742 RepID=A0ABD2YX33_9GENT
MDSEREKIVTTTTCETMQLEKSRHDDRELISMNRNINNQRANAIRRLQRLRMKRKVENEERLLVASPRSTRLHNIPVPPTPPAREVNASKMQFLFEKRLKYSDVKEEGRIVLPKAFAEKYMPALESKKGIYMFMDDMVAPKIWMFRYRYWPNNSSKVYVLENTGEFVKAYGLQAGDFIMVYKDNESQRFGIGTRKCEAKEGDHREVSPNAAAGHALPTSKNNLVGKEQSGSTSSCCHGPPPDQQAAPATKSSEYSDGLRGFPFHLLQMEDFENLPERREALSDDKKLSIEEMPILTGFPALAYKGQLTLYRPFICRLHKARKCSSIAVVETVKVKRKEVQFPRKKEVEGNDGDNKVPEWKKLSSRELGIQNSMIARPTRLVLNCLRKKGIENISSKRSSWEAVSHMPCACR